MSDAVTYELAENDPDKNTVTVRIRSERGIFLYEVARKPIIFVPEPATH